MYQIDYVDYEGTHQDFVETINELARGGWRPVWSTLKVHKTADEILFALFIEKNK